MSQWNGSITIADIFRTSNNWKRYLAWKCGRVREAVLGHVPRMLACRTPQLGLHLFVSYGRGVNAGGCCEDSSREHYGQDLFS